MPFFLVCCEFYQVSPRVSFGGIHHKVTLCRVVVDVLHCLLQGFVVVRLFGPSTTNILRMCPSHWCLRARIHITMLKEVVVGDASSCLVRPVMCDTIIVFAPRKWLQTSFVRCHPSLPYVIIEQQPATYNRILSISCSSAAHSFRSFPAALSLYKVPKSPGCETTD